MPEGVITRETADCPEAQSRASIHDLDSLPDPDFDDSFKALDKFKFKEAIRPGLLMETSRGCWWGDRRGCIFCGLNRLGKTYRIKTPARARAELERLTARHGIKSMEMVDNLLSHDYFNTFLAGLAADKPGYNIFYETRTSLSHEQAKTLADAGVTYIQAGLEALSDELLRHMRKGVSAFQNIQTLKYARELGIKVVWHLLGGFP